MELEEKLESLLKEREKARILFERYTGAIELIEGLLKEKKEEKKSGHKKANS